MVSLIPLSILSQTNRWKMKQLRRNEHVLYLSCFFSPEVCLLEDIFLHQPGRGGCSQGMTKKKLKGWGNP